MKNFLLLIVLCFCGLSYGQTNISVNTVKMKETTAPTGQAGWDMIYGDSSIHRPRFVNNGGSSVTVALLSDNLSVFASTTSAQFLGVISDEIGTGSLLAANSNTQDSPTFTTKISVTENTAPSGATGKAVCYADSTVHALECSYNNGTFGQVVTTNATQTVSAKTFASPAFTGTETGMSITSPAMTSPTVNTGISQGSGLKHQRFGATCSTAATPGSTCVTTETWTSAFADSSYTVTCTGVTGGNNAILQDVESVTASTFVIRVQQPNAAAAASFAGIDCIAIHD